MNVMEKVSSLTGGVNSLLVKSALIAAIMTLAVVATMSVLETIDKRSLVQSTLSSRAANVSELLSLQLGEAIKLANEADVSEIAMGVDKSRETGHARHRCDQHNL